MVRDIAAPTFEVLADRSASDIWPIPWYACGMEDRPTPHRIEPFYWSVLLQVGLMIAIAVSILASLVILTRS